VAVRFLDAAVEFGAISGGLAVAWAALSGTSRRLRRMEHRLATFWHAWCGTPAEDGMPAQPGVMERIGAQDAELAEIKAQIGELRGDTVAEANAGGH
jgi:hypothetical protein